MANMLRAHTAKEDSPAVQGTSARKINNAQMKEIILKKFKEKKSWNRKNLISVCLELCPLTPEERRDRSTNSRATRYKSLVGSVLAEMLDNGDLLTDEDKNLSLAKEEGLIVKEGDVQTFLLKLLQDKRLTKKEIYKQIEQNYLPKDYTQEDVQNLRNVAGNVLARLTKNEEIRSENGLYSRVVVSSRFPNTELGNLLWKAEQGASLYTCFIRALNLKGGEFFEFFSAKLIERYFQLAKLRIDSSTIVGGADDNGIDIIIETTDWLGYKEKVFVQAKVKSTTAVTLKEVREFYGALQFDHGTRGIFITTSTFHLDAAKMISGIYNLIAIDNRKLFEMAKYCEVGFRKDGNRYVLDEQIFLDE
ncbi:MAG: restriction endonuclease [Clostridia bacterium]|nr:restriction endonuclease [Clostridia bacterium]